MNTMTAKRVRIVFSRPRREVEIDLEPGDTPIVAIDKAFTKLGVQGNAADYDVLKPDNTEYNLSDDLFQAGADKFHVVPKSEVSEA